MAIRRAARPEHHFTQIRNDVLRDPRLSYRARGLLAVILSHSDDWTTSAESLARQGQEGRDAIRTALTELEDAGYLKREKTQDERGRWATHAVVYDVPQGAVQPTLDSTGDGFPGVGFPAVGFPGPIKNTIKNTSPNGEAATAAGDSGAKAPAPADVVAKDVYDHAKGMVKYMAVRTVATRALKLDGQTPESIAGAMKSVYDAGRPVTLETVGQHLAGNTGSGKWSRAAKQDLAAHADYWAQPGATF